MNDEIPHNSTTSNNIISQAQQTHTTQVEEVVDTNQDNKIATTTSEDANILTKPTKQNHKSQQYQQQQLALVESNQISLINRSWSRKILELVGNKARLMESFSWLSTVGGGYSSLGEKDSHFSMRAGRLSLGQQLHLAELLGDQRLKVMCHIFATLAALQLDNKHFCINYIRKVILPLINNLPYSDPVLTNMLKYICFRLHTMDASRGGVVLNNAIEAKKR